MNRVLALAGDAFCDHSGGVSCQRVVCFVVTFVVLGMWIWGCFVAGKFLYPDWPMVGLLGGSQAAKAAQSRFELGQSGLQSLPGSGVFGG